MIQPWIEKIPLQQEIPDAPLLARNCTGGIVNIRNRPASDADIVEKIYEDTLLIWEKEIIGELPMGRSIRKWIQTPRGYVYSPSFQPVKNQPNQIVSSFPQTAIGTGMWAEVSILRPVHRGCRRFRGRGCIILRLYGLMKS